MSSRGTCPSCGSCDLESDSARGDIVCTSCGAVIEDNLIVNEIQFSEGSHGSSSVIGKSVSTEVGFHGLSMGGLVHSGRESKDITLSKAKRKIRTTGSLLSLNTHCIEMSYNFYKMALNRRLTYGRKNNNVIAACIYITCRLEGTPHMLLDLSDVTQVNVYELGKTYLRISTALCLKIPVLDPCHYIVRFAHKLSLDDKTHEVEMTALRLVQRMKRDWMHHGRRPSGLCGAALLVAARLHSIHCTVKEIVDVVKVCETTIRKRLNEFGETPTSKLTLEEFMTVDLEGEEDPPCYKAASKRPKLIENFEEMEEEVNKFQKEIDEKLEKVRSKFRIPYSNFKYIDNGEETDEALEERVIEQLIQEDHYDIIHEIVGSKDTEAESFLEQIKALRPTAASLGLPSRMSMNFHSMHKDQEEDDNDEDEDEEIIEDGELDLEGIDEEELDKYILSKNEVLAKTKLWNKVNAEYIKECEEKEKRKLQEEEERKKKEESGELPLKKKRKMRKKTNVEATTAGEAIEKMLEEKRLSNKINYDVLRQIDGN